MVQPCSHSNCVQNNVTTFILTLYNVHVIQCGDFIYKSGDILCGHTYWGINSHNICYKLYVKSMIKKSDRHSKKLPASVQERHGASAAIV
jgi:hypothetical protein